MTIIGEVGVDRWRQGIWKYVRRIFNIIRAIFLMILVLIALILLAFVLGKQELTIVSYPNPWDDQVSFLYEVRSPLGRTSLSGKALLYSEDGPEVSFGEVRGRLYESTYWVNARQVNVCPLAGRLAGPAATVGITGQDNVYRAIRVTTDCGPKTLKVQTNKD